jgi:hypothetical protein
MFKNIIGSVALLALPLAAMATEYRTVDRPRQECWNEQVAVRGGGGDIGSALIGGVAGGLLGNTIGGGNGRTAATAVGAVTGAMVGDRVWGSQTSVQNVQRCRTVIDKVQVPVYYQAAPVAAPVVVEQRYYVPPPAPVYVEPWQREQWRREQWRREHWRQEEWRREREREREWAEEHRRHEWREHHGYDER